VSALGAGGMGEVYRARDSKLNREVALKVLPEIFALDTDHLARFTREAHVLASLNHPNIAAIYGLEESSGLQALVLELVPGPTLADRLSSGSIPLDEALAIARQIAHALEAAHEQGIIHRDLKPANVKLRPDGEVKVLDFGLAKVPKPPVPVVADATASPTFTSPAMTGMGVILGTAAYMSPEQAVGRPADRRSDLWAFGCVLYEMLAGKRAFPGKDVPETLATVIKNDPDWRALPSGTPAPVRRLLHRCLVKDPKQRVADASTARLEIDDALASPPEAHGVAPGLRRLWRSGRVAWAAAGVVLLGALFLTLTYARRITDDAPPVRASIPAPDGTFIDAPSVIGRGLSVAVSPDGKYLVFVATGADNRPRLWLRSLDGNSAEPLPGTEGGVRPFWSPDSRSIAFFNMDRKLRRIDVESHRVVTLYEDPRLSGGGGTWNADGHILFGYALGGDPLPLFRVADSGGMVTPVTQLDVKAGERLHGTPVFLPDGRHFLYTVHPAAGPRAVYVGSTSDSLKTLLLPNAANAQYALGRLMFVRGTTLLVQPFDAERLALTGEAVPIADGVAVESFSRTGAFSVSATGVLAYHAGAGDLSQLTLFDRAGNRIRVLGELANYNTVNLSRDGARAAVSVRDPSGDMDLWIVDVARGVRTRFTFDPGDDSVGAWSPDSTRIAVDTVRRAARNVVALKAADGSGVEDTIDQSPFVKYPTSWSSDGRFLLFNSAIGTGTTGNDLWVAPLFGDRKPFVFLQTPFNETRAQFSTDGRWIAYQSNESGREEVYVAGFPGPVGKRQISAAGGNSPRWRHDGRELFYVATDGRMMATAVDGRGSTFDVGATQALFTPRIRDQNYGIPFDVTADGQRLLVNTLLERPAASSITLVVNWPSLLTK
jgi:Tol biopolymer transport system component